MTPDQGAEILRLIPILVDSLGPGRVIFIIILFFVIISVGPIISFIKDRSIQRSIEKLTRDINSVVSQKDNLKNHINNEEASFNTIKDNISNIKNNITSLSSTESEINKEIALNLSNMADSIEKISDILKNVIREEDAIKISSYLLGISESFKSIIVRNTLLDIDTFFNYKDGQLSHKLKIDLNAAWEDFKNEFLSFKMPINSEHFLQEIEENFWLAEGFFTKILNIAISEQEIDLKKIHLQSLLNEQLRLIQKNLFEFIKEHKL